MAGVPVWPKLVWSIHEAHCPSCLLSTVTSQCSHSTEGQPSAFPKSFLVSRVISKPIVWEKAVALGATLSKSIREQPTKR